MKPQIKIILLISLFFKLSFSTEVKAQSFSIELYPSWYGDYNISYFGGNDGAIDMQITGGMPPYIYRWSNGAETEMISNLPAGYYRVDVWDSNGIRTEGEITLIQPGPDINPAEACASTSGIPVWSAFTNSQLLFTCPVINVSVGSYIVLPGIKFSVYGNSYITGRVGIGTDPTINNANDYQLVVGGKIGAREVIVSSLTPWPDYVFDKDYKLASLSELKDYVNEHHHLPDFPSANDIIEKGQSIGEIQNLQQRKIEELYLYIIQLENRIHKLEKNKKSN